MCNFESVENIESSKGTFFSRFSYVISLSDIANGLLVVRSVKRNRHCVIFLHNMKLLTNM
jgi:hypothetical protein